ncbi:MAG: aminotransferase class IV [Mobilicoccus sp.]|nr:aminotransferase class IV [Mobilicoccus sp.]
MTTWRWVDGDLVPADDVAGPLRVADSWRHVEGRVRRWDLHRDRFTAATSALGHDRADVDAFLDAVARAVPETGEWFPRVRLVADTLLLDVREGPPRKTEAVVHVLSPGDPRAQPRTKGPDLARLGVLIEEARAGGADEILLRDEQGRILEAGYAALVWWEDDVLFAPAADLPLLPSVTRRVVTDHARREGVVVREVTAPIDALSGREAWLLNAYQGLRIVTAWSGVDIAAGPATHARRWRAALEGDSAFGPRPVRPSPRT